MLAKEGVENEPPCELNGYHSWTALFTHQNRGFSHIHISENFGIGVKMISYTPPFASPHHISPFYTYKYHFGSTSYFKQGGGSRVLSLQYQKIATWERYCQKIPIPAVMDRGLFKEKFLISILTNSRR